MTPDLDAWDAWHPQVLAVRLDGVEAPWCVAAGWALDLFRGTQTRPHGDVEIAVPDTGFTAVAARFDDCDFFTVHDGRLQPATDASLRVSHQTWARERATGKWRLDVFREPHDGTTWICRRDPRIRRPYAEVVEHTPDGIPYLVPEIVLLFKAHNPRDKDETDFTAVLPLLDGTRRQWLGNALALTGPTHPWRASIG